MPQAKCRLPHSLLIATTRYAYLGFPVRFARHVSAADTVHSPNPELRRYFSNSYHNTNTCTLICGEDAAAKLTPLSDCPSIKDSTCRAHAKSTIALQYSKRRDLCMLWHMRRCDSMTVSLMVAKKHIEIDRPCLEVPTSAVCEALVPKGRE